MTRSRRKNRGRESLVPHNCVILGIDPGATSGAAVLEEGGKSHLWSSAECRNGFDRGEAIRIACVAARAAMKPLVVVAEKWSAGGKFSSPRVMSGLGASWGMWEEGLVALADRGVWAKKRIVRVYPQTWHAAVIGGPLTRDKSKVIAWAAGEHGVWAGPDVACAIAIAKWGAYAPEVAEVLPKRWKAPVT